jgi:nicotinamidase-related amidase
MSGSTEPEKTALLVIDVQVSMFDDPEPPYQADTLLRTIAGVIDKAREAGTPVIYIQHDHATYEPMKRGQPGWHIHPAIAPQTGEPVINKQASDSFYETTLHSVLQARGITHLVIAGMQTEACVDTTCRSATSHKYDVTLVADGHSTWDTPHISAAQMIAQTNSSLANIAHPTHSIVPKPANEITFSGT